MKWPFGNSTKEKLRIEEYNDNNFKRGQKAVIFTASVSLIAALVCRRSVIRRRFVPKQFNSNIHPSQFSPVKDAARAAFDATLLATTFFSFSVASVFWYLNVFSLEELGKVLKSTYSPKRLEVSDSESRSIQNAILKWINK